MIELESIRVIEAEPDEVLDLAFDPILYQAVDEKIIRVHADQRGLGRRLIELSQRVGPIRLPRQVLQVTRDQGASVTFEQVGGRRALQLLRYRAQLLVDPLEEGCLVTHRYTIGFRGPVGWLIDPLVHRHLRIALEAEMDRLVDHFDGTVIELDDRR